MPEHQLPSRRSFLTAAVGTAGFAAGAGIAGMTEARAETAMTGEPADRVPFYGPHQAGIATPAQDRLAFAAFDITSHRLADVRSLLRSWASAAARFTSGDQLGPVETRPQAPPIDTGETLGLGPAMLTVTVGFGPGLFDHRFGLERHRPAALADLPGFPGDQLDPKRTGGDLCVQACANDPQVAFHVVRNFARIAQGTSVLRWTQLGFGRTSSASLPTAQLRARSAPGDARSPSPSPSQATPRNLMGFKDGTRNIKTDDTAQLDSYVWVGAETDQPWMRGGSYLVARRIQMSLEVWDADDLTDQEDVFGRRKDTGAPLTGTDEFDTPDLSATRSDGTPVIPLAAHIRLASPANNGGEKILRRGYSFTDGIDPATGQLNAGLFFLAYQRDPRQQFVPIQRRLGRQDALNEYIRHTGSGLFAIPPGLSGPGDWYGKTMLD
jgi:deferrochelatase/peroxidase EfeB